MNLFFLCLLKIESLLGQLGLVNLLVNGFAFLQYAIHLGLLLGFLSSCKSVVILDFGCPSDSDTVKVSPIKARLGACILDIQPWILVSNVERISSESRWRVQWTHKLDLLHILRFDGNFPNRQAELLR